MMKQLLYKVKNKDTLEDALAAIRMEAGPAPAPAAGPAAPAATAAAPAHQPAILLHIFCGDICSGSDFSCAPFVEHILRRVREELPQARIIGLSTGGEIRHADMLEPCVLFSVFLFERSWVRVLSFPDLAGREREAGERLFAEVESSPDLQGVEILFAGDGIDPAPIYKSLRESRAWLPFFGGYAVEHDAQREPAFLITRDGVLRTAMAAVLYGGDALEINPGRTTGWKPLGATFRVTEAEGRRLISVNGVPAYDLYDRFLKFPEGESFADYTKEFPLMLIKGKMRILRHPQEKYDDSSILLDGSVKVGDEICVSYGAPLEVVRKMNARCEKMRAFEPEAVLLYSCQGRKNYWGDLIGWEMEPFQKVAETGGACLSGQIMRNNQTGRVIEHRLTLLSMAFREGAKTGRAMPEIAVDDEILRSRMSVMYRMSTLIESVVDELKRANDTLTGMNERLARANDELHRIAIIDELTGLYNRREIERRIKEALARARTDHRKIALVMLDIDFFKKVNDTYGHDVGDIVLKDVSAILQEAVDEAHGEATGRWGGEEFFVLLPDLTMEGAIALAERIRVAVELHDFPEARHLTVSMGVTSADPEANYQSIFIQADQALYEAKQSGRNRVVAFAE